MKILVADDCPVSRHMMARTLRQSGYEAIMVQDGRRAAHELSQRAGPRLALIDWMMPELDGPELCREIRSRQDGGYVYVLLLTAKQSHDDIVQGLKAGADDYLAKPCHPAELQARLQTGRRILELEDKLVEAREEMRFKATHDALTSLWDRGAIFDLLRSELSRSLRNRVPVSLLLCDIDHFKQINDGYGHLVGDEILQSVSARLNNAVRSHDAVGRYGGEEFLVLLGGCDNNNLKLRAEQIRTMIGHSPFHTSSGPISVSLSIGAITVETCDNSIQPEYLLRQVDEALYRAKTAGRDQVAYADLALTI